MMKQLNVADILACVTRLKKSGMSDQELLTLPVYIGDDDELNGIHCAWEASLLDATDQSDSGKYVLELINEDSGNYPLIGKAILIS